MRSELLLISDLDDTLLGDAEALARFADYHERQGGLLKVVYASGRFCDTIQHDVETTPLPAPAAMIGGVGSEIRSFPGGELNEHWVRKISTRWSASTVRSVLANEPGLQLQPETSLSDFKVSYYYHDATSEQLEGLRKKLLDAGVEVSMIYSSQRDLDFLPKEVDKGTAAAFVAEQLGFNRERVVVAGNSANDSKLFDHGFSGVIVANAHDELKRLSEDPKNYLSPHQRADGVRDGIEHWWSHLDKEAYSTASLDAPSQEEGYQRAIELMHECCVEQGFLATPIERHNYRRIWARDSSIMGLAALMSGDPDLIAGCRRSLQTLARYQGPHGEIPSNVDPVTDRVSYGGTAGRVDGNLWFVITCGAYYRTTGDDEFLHDMLNALERVRYLLGAWEFNTRGLIYIPPTGDWADEYLQSGYVLYDQLLYLQAQREYGALHRALHKSADHELDARVAKLKHLIQANYWFTDSEHLPDDVYHEVLYDKGRDAAPHRSGSYWMPFFSPFGYGYRFDAFANSLATLLEVSDDQQNEAVDRTVREKIVQSDVMLLPAFHPVITPKDEYWEDLQVSFSHTFKNAPYEYHNGGLWPLVTGFYVACLAKRGKRDLATKYLNGIHAANRGRSDGRWDFPEFLHGRRHTPGGTMRMGWSAAAAVIAHRYLEEHDIFTLAVPGC